MKKFYAQFRQLSWLTKASTSISLCLLFFSLSQDAFYIDRQEDPKALDFTSGSPLSSFSFLKF